MKRLTHPPLRVVLCGCDGAFTGLVLRQILADPGLCVTGVVRSTRILDPHWGPLRGAWHQVRRSGLRYALYLWFATTGTAGLARLSLRCLVRPQGVPLHATRDINDAAATAFVAAARPDILLSAFFNQRIGERVRALSAVAAVNIHPSPLPDFKGVDPVFHASLARSDRFGVTLHAMTERLDTGPILAQCHIDRDPTESLFRTTARLFSIGAQQFCAACADGTIRGPGRPQPGSGRYDSWPDPAQTRALRHNGGRLIRAMDLSWAWRTVRAAAVAPRLQECGP